MKLLKALGSVTLAFSLMACSSSSSSGTSETPAEEETQAEESEEATAEADAATENEPSQEILIGISPDYPPYESKSTDGNIEGFDIDMAEWLFKYLNENGHNYTYDFEELSFDTIISSLQAGQIDLGISGFTYAEDREGIFSDSYYDSAQVLIVKSDSDITGTDDLNGKLVGAQQGTTGEDVANDIEGAEVNAQQDMQVIMETLKADGLDAVVLDKAVADNYVKNGDFKIVGEPLLIEENVIYSTEEHQELMDQINEAIKAFKADPDYETLTTKWFGVAE